MVKSVKDEKRELDKIHKELDGLQDRLRRSYQVDGLSSRNQVAEAKHFFRIVKDRKLRCESLRGQFKDDPLKKKLEDTILDLFQRHQPDARHVGIIICAIVCELSDLSDIYSNRLWDMINDKESMRKARFLPNYDPTYKARRQSELYELTLSTWCSYFPRKFENRAQSHRFNDIHDDLYSSDEKIPKFNKYRACLIIKNMVVHSPGYYYRNLSRNQTVVRTIENLVQLVSEFRDDQQPARLVSELSDDGELRLAALSALRSLIVLISSREIYTHIESDWQRRIVFLVKAKLKGDTGAVIGSILVLYQLLDIIPVGVGNRLDELEAKCPYEKSHTRWNPANEQSKTEKFFHQVFDRCQPRHELKRTKQPRGAQLILNNEIEHLLKELARHFKSTSPAVHSFLLPLLPKLAAFNPLAFQAQILPAAIAYCIGQIKQKTNRQSALSSIGLIIYVIAKSGSKEFGEHDYIQNVIDCFKQLILTETGMGLGGHNFAANKSRILPDLFQSLNLITIGLGENPKENLHQSASLWAAGDNRHFLNLVMAAGYANVTTEWMESVQNLNRYIPSEQIASGIEQILLNILLDIEFPSNVIHERSLDHACLSRILTRDWHFGIRIESKEAEL